MGGRDGSNMPRAGDPREATPHEDDVVQHFLLRLLRLRERERPEATGEPVSRLHRGVSAKAQSER
jgi:hypothetical protein